MKSIVTWDGELPEAFAPMAVTLTLADEIDVSRGDMLVRPENLPRVDRNLDAMVVWMAEEPLVPGRQYWIKHAGSSSPAPSRRSATASTSTRSNGRMRRRCR